MTEADWHRLALRSLARSRPGAGDLDALVTTTADGIAVRPLHTGPPGLPPIGRPGLAPFVRHGRADGSTAGWDLRVQHGPGRPDEVRAAIAEDLAGGATSIWLTLDEAGVAALPELLAGVPLERVPVALDAGQFAGAAADRFLALAARHRPAGGTLGLDPLGHNARSGDERPPETVAGPAIRCAASLPGVRPVLVDGLPYTEAGASDAEELGCTLATAVAYLRALTTAGMPVAVAVRQLEFRLGAGPDQFLTLAKLRAARLLWWQVTARCGAPAPQRQHAVTPRAVLTAVDPLLNVVRGTLAGFAAVTGGAEAVTVQPHDAALGPPGPAARRLARNTQLLLRYEARIGEVIDPAGGSWYVEQLTRDLAAAAWAWFQQIEQAGGMAAALAGGPVRERLDRTRRARTEAVARLEQRLTGVNAYPDLTLRTVPAADGTTGGATADGATADGTGPAGLPAVRWAEPFERLRARTDAAPERPLVFLAVPAGGGAEAAALARDALALAGIGTVAGPPGLDPAGLADAFAASGAGAACLCAPGPDAQDAAAALARAGARRVLLADVHPPQRPGTDRLYPGCDLPAALAGVVEALTAA